MTPIATAKYEVDAALRFLREAADALQRKELQQAVRAADDARSCIEYMKKALE